MEAILMAIKRLNHQRGQIRAKLTIISKFVNDSCLETVDQAEVQLRLEQMPELKAQYDKIMLDTLSELDNVEITDQEAKTADQYAKSEEFDKDWCATIVKLRKLCKVKPKINPETNTRQITSANVQLPQIKIADFDGAYHQWLPFYNSFRSLIYDNKSLDDVAKLHYLRSCVKGEAFKTIQALTLAPANFYVAWELLEKRFHNERLIVDDHVRSILNLPDIPKSNYAALSNFLSEIRCHIEALKSLKIPVESWDAILVSIINNKLDYRTRELWSETLETTVPKFNDLLDFLDGRCNFLKSFRDSNSDKHERGIAQASHKGYHRGPRVANVSVNHNPTCGYCKLPHVINVCPEFLSLSVTSRIEKATALKLCKNCLRPNHNSTDCKSRWKCRICRKPHHSILHKCDGTSNPEVTSSSTSNSAPQFGGQSNSINHCLTVSRQVVLSTAIVLMADKHGTWVKCRVLLDPGSQLNFLPSDFCKKLGLPIEYDNAPIVGIGGIRSQIKHKTVASIKSMYADFQVSAKCCVTDTITRDLPCTTFDKNLVEIPSDIFLADPTFNSRGPVDCLLGAELFWSLLCNEQLKLPNQDLFLTKTYFGWLIGGSFNMKSSPNSLAFSCNVAASDDLQKSITRFWEQEEIAAFTRETHWSGEERACENLFKTTTTRDAVSGRFVVQLPLKHNPAHLGESYSSSLRRFLALERRFAKDSAFKMNYCAVIREYLTMDHAQLIPEHKIHAKNENVRYLPHHAVFKESENGRKTRVVFDASSITTNQSSLNANLMTGPVIQDDLFSILTRFRAHTFVFTTDLVHMYRQILIDDEFTDLQRIVWRFNDDEPIKVYKLKRLTFGLASSSFLAIRCVQQLAQDSINEVPEFPDIVKQQMYVDDILYGHDDLQHAIKQQNKQRQVKTAFAQAGFPLAKWHSNHEALLSFADQRPATSAVRPFDNDSTKTLGMLWVPYSDTFTFQVKPNKPQLPLTKRKILSAISQLFDPLGLLAPVIIKANILMQTLWGTGLDWDDEVPRDIREQWEQYCYHLQSVNNVSIPRHAAVPNAVSVELCAFSDASQKAYGTVIFLRACDTLGNFTTRVLASKSRVCPIHVKQGGRRSIKTVKTYGAIFVCMATRVVHFELVGDLTAESFLNAFKRFISRRGNASEVFSDNGRNFVGGNAELKRVAVMLKSSEFSQEFSKHFETVKWHFMPARSPNFRGLHERSIKGAKLHIKRVLDNASLTFEEMYTLLVRIEALLNSRPLCPLSNDRNDLQALTPSHLLIGELIIAPVEPDLTELPQNRLTRWRRLEQLRQHFWRRWSKEVLAELQYRSKWKHASAEPIKPGDMVLVSEDNLPPLMWKLGRVLQTYPGPDKLVRVAEIQTSSSIIKRSVRKLAVLPLEE